MNPWLSDKPQFPQLEEIVQDLTHIRRREALIRRKINPLHLIVAAFGALDGSPIRFEQRDPLGWSGGGR
jgi:hypothetical protein